MENQTESGAPHAIYFQWYDHVFFGMLLFLSTAIGVYFSVTGGKKKDTTDEYFMGGKKMKVVPIAISLVASHISSVSLLSVPSDVYSFGAMYWLSVISILCCACATSYVFLPVFYELQLNSTYEYLMMRFNSSMRSVCSGIFIINILLLMGIMVYVPSLAYAQATGISVHYILPTICAICTFYTTIGGLKTVVWTDTLQFTITCGAVLIVLFLGLSRAGGWHHVFQTAWEGDRLNFDFDINPTKRETVVAVCLYWFLGYCRMLSTNQECVLKFLSLPSLKKAQKSIFLFCIGIVTVKTIVVITGLIMFTIYKDCDPLTSGQIDKIDQMIPYYVADVASGIPGLTGLFLSGVCCTALSTLSAMMNALSATIYQDFVTKYWPKWGDKEHTSTTIKLLVVIMGVFTTIVGSLVGHLGPILPLSISLSSITAGSFLGLFTMGVLIPSVNSKGATIGVISSTAVVAWMFIGSQWYKSKDMIKAIPTNLSTDQCTFQVAASQLNSTLIDAPEEIFYLYRVSHYYYAFIGMVLCLSIGIIASHFTEGDGKIDKRLLSPLVHRWVRDDRIDDYYTIDKANKIVSSVDMQELHDMKNRAYLHNSPTAEKLANDDLK